MMTEVTVLVLMAVRITTVVMAGAIRGVIMRTKTRAISVWRMVSVMAIITAVVAGAVAMVTAAPLALT